MRRLKALELFGCAGGMGLGFLRAGIHFDAVLERDPDHAQSYAHNVGHKPIEMDVHAFLPVGHYDLIVADPPCTPWSISGNRRGLADPRDCLVPTVDLVRNLRPTAFLLANVPGLDTAPMQAALHRVLDPLCGSYCVDYANLNAANFGVPQLRRRPFWFFHPRGTSCIRWPAPSHYDPRRGPSLFGDRRPWVTVREAFADWPLDLIVERPVRLKSRGNNDRPWSTLDRPALTATASRPGGSSGGATLAWDPSMERPSTTICAHSDGRPGRPGHHGAKDSRQLDGIVLTVPAMAHIQGFPRDAKFFGSKSSQRSQVGQAMPPPMAARVAESIAQWFVENEQQNAQTPTRLDRPILPLPPPPTEIL